MVDRKPAPSSTAPRSTWSWSATSRRCRAPSGRSCTTGTSPIATTEGSPCGTTEGSPCGTSIGYATVAGIPSARSRPRSGSPTRSSAARQRDPRAGNLLANPGHRL